MPKVNSIAEALKIVKEKVEAALLVDVAETVKRTEIRHVYEDVYSRPESRLYQRRYSGGGIGDISNLEEYVEGDTLVVANTTPFNPYLNGTDSSAGYSQNAGLSEGLDGLIEYGDRNWKGIAYDWATYEPARPFVKNTVEELRASKEHVRALAGGLRKRGLNVK